MGARTLRRLLTAMLLAVVAAVIAGPAGAVTVDRGAVSLAAVHHDTSPALRSIPPASPSLFGPRVVPLRPLPRRSAPAGPRSAQTGAVQQRFGARAAPAILLNFDGLGNGFAGPAGSFSVDSAPPDPNLAVGPNHIVELVNTSFAVFDKSGTAILGPVATNTLWSGFSGGCQTNNDGDGTVSYDPIADRWVIQQFSVSSTPYLDCLAVSQTPDPTGAWHRYAFSYGNSDFPDYPKLAVWPDAYYISYNIFAGGGNTFNGARVCALDRAAMLTGAAATQQCFNTNTSYGGILPSSLDGARQPPSGSPNYVVGLGATASNTIAYWKFHVDWTTSANSTFTGPTELAVGTYDEACSGGGTCIPQSGTTQQLDSLADRVMYRLAYRNFGDHESLVVNHSVVAGSSTGIRWYELRPNASHNLSVFQQGTYAPDSNFRWMGSIAEDQVGDMGLGFSVSGSSIHPEIHYTGRLAGDAAGTMTQGEGSIIDGAGSQTGGSLSRWGDYSAMAVDPSDDCTFFYTTEYIPATGAFNWSTRIGSFKFPSCASPSNDFSIAANPNTVTVPAGGSGSSTIPTAVTSGSARSVALSISGVPGGATATFSPTSVTAGSSSTLTLDSGTAAAGTYTLTITGTGASATHTTTVTFTINPVITNDFSVAVGPNTLTLNQGASGTSTISTAVTSGNAETVTPAVSGLPAGASASFTPTSVTAGSSSTLTINAGTAAPGNYAVTITGTTASATHAANLSLTIRPNGFSIAVSPNTLTLNQGASGTSTISTAVTSGNAETVTPAVSGLPAGAGASFSPTSVTAGGRSTLTINAGLATPGVYRVIVTGTAPSATHTTSITLTVRSARRGGIINGGFETGNRFGWMRSGASVSVVNRRCHGGHFCARVGASKRTKGDSNLAQRFTAPTGVTRLSFFYEVVCTDAVRFDWATAKLRDNTSGFTRTVLRKTCTNTGRYVQAVTAVTAGHSYTLTLTSHDDNFAGDPTYTLYDDVTQGRRGR